MRFDRLDFSAHGDTLLAVVVGALLATLSGVLANQFEAAMHRRERERAAAMLFGEVISSLLVLLDSAHAARGVGDPYGPVTRRILQSARREIDIYERNRESLLHLREPSLRVDIHTLMVRISMPLDGVLDSFLSPATANDEARARGLEFMMANVAALPGIVDRLGRIARHKFERPGDIRPSPAAR